jgi:hypothetical protein
MVRDRVYTNYSTTRTTNKNREVSLLFGLSYNHGQEDIEFSN